MPIGAFTGSFDLPLLLVDVFVLFFFALVYYLRKEDKREGYPLVAPSRRDGRVEVVGFPGLPKPKTFRRPHGLPPKVVPSAGDPSPVPIPPHWHNPNGMPVDDGTPRLGQSLGPGSWVEREDEPDRSHDGEIVFRPMRRATDTRIMKGEADPRGYVVLGCDKAVAGRVVDIWVDTSEHYAKFLEVELEPALRVGRPAGPVATDAAGGGGDRPGERIAAAPHHDADERPAPTSAVLLPMEFAAVDASRRQVRTGVITGAQFAGVPGRRRDAVLTAREENRLRGYYGGGYLWATPRRVEPLL